MTDTFYYRIAGIPGLEGLIAESSAKSTDPSIPLHIDTLVNPNAVLGDRTVKFPIPENALFITARYLESCPDPNREFSTESPFGKLQFEGHLKRDELCVDYVRYENAITITIREDYGENGRTVYTQNFFGDSVPQALAMVEAVMAGKQEVDELVFQLKDLKEEELRGAR